MKRGRAEGAGEGNDRTAWPPAVEGARRLGFLVTSLLTLLLSLLPAGPLGFLPVTAAAVLGVFLAFPSLRTALGERPPMWLRSGRWWRAAEPAGLAVVFGSFLLLKLPGIHPSVTDENVYFYMAARFAEGLIPYRDFFFAHPPLHLVIPAAVFSLTGFNLVVAKLIPVTAALIYGFFFYLSLRRAAGASAALPGLVGLLFAYQVLMASTDMTGVNLTLMFLAAGLYAAVSSRWALAGVLAGLALATGTYALAGVIALGLAALASSRKTGLRFLLGSVAGYGIIMGFFWWIGGSRFIDGVFRYHFLKAERIAGWTDPFTSLNPAGIVVAVVHNLRLFLSGKVFLQTLYFHAPLFLVMVGSVGALLIGIIRGLPRGGRRTGATAPHRGRNVMATPLGFLVFSLGAVILFLLQWANLREVYDFYLLLMIFFVPIPFGYAFQYVFQRASAGRSWRSSLAAPAALLLLWAYLPLCLEFNASLWPSEAASRGREITYEWRDPAAFSGLSHLTKRIFFRDRRMAGEFTPYYRHYLWNKMITFSTVTEISRYVQEHSGPDDTIAGASNLTPLVALFAGRRIAGEEVDTNAKRFKSGLLSPEGYFHRICQSGSFKFFLTAPRAYFSTRYVEGDEFARRCFVLERSFADGQAQFAGPLPIDLWRVREPGCGLGGSPEDPSLLPDGSAGLMRVDPR